MGEIKYHKILAAYFSDKSLFQDDEISSGKPNIRKLAEQPWQEVEAGLLIQVTKTLCSLLFIDAKVKAGMLEQLKTDYQKVFGTKTNYSLIQNAKNDPTLLSRLINLNDKERETPPEKPQYKPGEIMDTSIIKDEPEMTETIKKILDAGSGKNNFIHNDESFLIRSFYIFVSTQSHLLEQMPDQTLTVAFNYSDEGVVSGQAEELLSKYKKPWVSSYPRPSVSDLFPLCRFVFKLPKWYSTCLALARESDILISGGLDSIIRVWNISTGRQISFFNGHTGIVNSVAVSNDGKLAISGSDDKTIKIWDTSLNICIHTLLKHSGKIKKVAISGNGKLGASVGDEKTLSIWDIHNGKCLNVIEEKNGFNTVDITSDGNIIITGNDDETVKVWDYRTGKCLRIIKGHGYKFLVDGLNEHDYLRGPKTPVLSVVNALKGNLAVSCSSDRTVRIWNIKTGKCLRVIEYDDREEISEFENVYGEISITPDGRIVAVGDKNNVIQVWDVKSGIKLRMLKGHTGVINNVRISSDGTTIISSSLDGTIRTWDIANGIDSKELFFKPEKKFAINYDTDRLTSDEKIRVYIENKYLYPLWRQHYLRSLDDNLDYSDINIFDLNLKRPLRKLNRRHEVLKFILQSDNRKLISMNREEKDSVHINFWDIVLGICINKLNFKPGSWLIDQTPDGENIVIDTKDDTIQIINIISGKSTVLKKESINLFSAASISANGRYLAAGDENGRIYLWELSSCNKRLSFNGHSGSVTNIIFSPDAEKIISTGNDNTIKLWNSNTGECLSSYSPNIPLIINSFFTPDGHIESWWNNQSKFFAFHNIHFNSPLVTPVRLFNFFTVPNDYEKGLFYYTGEAIPGKYDDFISFKCPWCQSHFTMPTDIHKTINIINEKYHIEKEDSPCIKLPLEAWNEPELESNCPGCNHSVKFNPFIVDNQSKFQYNSRIDEYGKVVRLLNEKSFGKTESIKIYCGIGNLCRNIDLIEEAAFYFESVVRYWKNYKKEQIEKGLNIEKEYSLAAACAFNELAFHKFVPHKEWDNAAEYYSEAIKLFENSDNILESINSQLNLHWMFYLSGQSIDKQIVTEITNMLVEKGDKRAEKGKALIKKLD